MKETAKTIDPANDASGNPYYNNLYWSFDYGPVHFTIVNEYSSFEPGSPQYNWVVKDMSSTTKPWKILVYHEPSYSAGSDADNIPVRALEPLVTKYNYDLIYCGHSHNYARTGAYNLAQANNDPIALNVPHLTSGGGGAPVYQTDLTNAAGYPHVITAWPAYEFMTFDVNGKTLEIRAYQVNNIPSMAGRGIAFLLPAKNVTPPLTFSPIETIVLNHFTNVSSQVKAVPQITCDSTTAKCSGSLTVTNTGRALTGNLDVVLDGILYLQGIGNADNQYSTKDPKDSTKIATNPACGNSASSCLVSDVTLVNATGSNNGEPMIRATSSGLAHGASVVVPLSFSNPNKHETITFNPVVYQE